MKSVEEIGKEVAAMGLTFAEDSAQAAINLYEEELFKRIARSGLSQPNRGMLITRKKLMKVLDKVFLKQGVKITVRGYNEILTDLGFELDNEDAKTD